MAKKKRRKRDKFKLKKGKRKKQKIKFVLEDTDLTGKEVVRGVIERLKKIRPLIHNKRIPELRFASDILSVINEVVVRYDNALSKGEFATSPCAVHLFRTLNYMMAAYQNIEKMLSEDSFRFLEEYYKILNLGDDKKTNKLEIESKLGNWGKQHIPLHKGRGQSKRKGVKIKKKKRKKGK